MDEDFYFALLAMNILLPVLSYYKVHMLDQITVVLTICSNFLIRQQLKPAKTNLNRDWSTLSCSHKWLPFYKWWNIFVIQEESSIFNVLNAVLVWGWGKQVTFMYSTVRDCNIKQMLCSCSGTTVLVQFVTTAQGEPMVITSAKKNMKMNVIPKKS